MNDPNQEYNTIFALCKIILHTSPAESPIFRSESTSFKRQPSPSETFADYSQNHKQIQPFMGFAKKSASNRSCRNAPTRTTPRGKRSFGRYAREAGTTSTRRSPRAAKAPQEPIRKRRRPLCATIRMKKTVCKRFATVFVSFDALQHLRIFEPKPRFNFAALVLSLPLAAGALSNLRKSLCDKRTETKKPLSSYLEAVFPFVPAPAALSQFRAETEILNSGPLHYE